MKPNNATDYCCCFNVTTKQQYKTINTAYSYYNYMPKSGPYLRDLNTTKTKTETFSLETETLANLSETRPYR